MPEPVDALFPKENPTLIPRGEVILGKIDPQTLTRGQFDSSPDLLWHGSAKPFEYDPNFDLNNNIENDNGATVGYGLYTTDSRSDAELFSMAFMRKTEEPREPIVTALLPFEAKMYDFRDVADIKKNADVPLQMEKDFAKFYASYFQHLYPNRSPTEGLMGMVYDLNKEYGDIINERASMRTRLDLRAMLSRGGRGRDVFGSAAEAFTKYMQSIGYDGVIYVEGGDHPQHNDPATFAFYNMHKIGTYKSWSSSTKKSE